MLSEALEVLSEAPDAMLTALALMWKLLVLGGSHRATPRPCPPPARCRAALRTDGRPQILVIIKNYPKKGCGRGGD